ncbi:hypothetical protein T4B_8412 [Trichinella pseudospiralis]|uniref:Uncharacterized protein n=1 Tax=Trichinella pseudospiralis TaxID=6337 RepID=A0A0V1FLC8_TRIPS|nr:hypothetical protein T4B_8412 [Trichinella pseudospiralis]
MLIEFHTKFVWGFKVFFNISANTLFCNVGPG